MGYMKGVHIMYQTRQHETFGPIPDNDWQECDEATVRGYLGSSNGVGTFAPLDYDMKVRGQVVAYCGLIDFRWVEEAS